MNKRKLLLVALSLCMVAILAMGGTLAYLTDTDEQMNVFTVGNIRIELHEDFTQESKLIPTTGIGPDGNYTNAVEKKVTVKNVGDSNAYLWIEVLIPSVLEDKNTPADASLNNLHFNPYDTYKTPDGDMPVKSAIAAKEGYELVAATVETYMGKVTIDGIEYNVYREHIDNQAPITPGESSHALLAQVYMDSAIDHCVIENCTCGGAGYELKDDTCYTGDWQILVRAYGIQADGFANVDAAIAAYYSQEPSDAK